MRPKSFTDNEILELVDGKQLSPAEAARALNVSRQAVGKRLQELKVETSRALAVGKSAAQRFVTGRLNAIERLEALQDKNDCILNHTFELLTSTPSEVKDLIGKEMEKPPDKRNPFLMGSNDPAKLIHIAFKALAESRSQLALQLELVQAMYNAEEIKRFQETMLAVIKEVSPDTQRRIIARLDEERKRRLM